MEFSEKIQALRKSKQLSQEELAEKLYISRTAISKWESGKGYPSIETLKDIANLFNITIDELLLNKELINIAQSEKETKKNHLLIYGLMDIINFLFIFLPIYPYKLNGFVYSVPLISQNDLSITFRIIFIILFLIGTLIGFFEILLLFVKTKKIQNYVLLISLFAQIISILFFAISRQTYLTVIVFILLLIKAFIKILSKNREHNCRH